MKIVILILLTLNLLYAVPAYSKFREFKHADGTVFIAKAQGNQYLNWIETVDGEILKYNEDSQNFEYANIQENFLKPSGIRYESNNSKIQKSSGRIKTIEKIDVYKLWTEKQNIHRMSLDKKEISHFPPLLKTDHVTFTPISSSINN